MGIDNPVGKAIDKMGIGNELRWFVRIGALILGLNTAPAIVGQVPPSSRDAELNEMDITLVAYRIDELEKRVEKVRALVDKLHNR